MIYLLAFFHSLYLSLVFWIGGSVKDRRLYILWAIKLNKGRSVYIENSHLELITKPDYFLVLREGGFYIKKTNIIGEPKLGLIYIKPR